jgi:hypothetical protein
MALDWLLAVAVRPRIINLATAMDGGSNPLAIFFEKNS